MLPLGIPFEIGINRIMVKLGVHRIKIVPHTVTRTSLVKISREKDVINPVVIRGVGGPRLRIGFGGPKGGGSTKGELGN